MENNEIKKTQNEQINIKKGVKNKKKSRKNKEKARYFDFYDDIKHDSHRDIAW